MDEEVNILDQLQVTCLSEYDEEAIDQSSSSPDTVDDSTLVTVDDRTSSICLLVQELNGQILQKIIEKERQPLRTYLDKNVSPHCEQLNAFWQQNL